MSDTQKTENLTGAEMARLIGVDGKDFRRFLRSVTDKEQQPGSGGRYSMTAADAETWAEMFANHSSSKGAKKITPNDVKGDDAKGDA